MHVECLLPTKQTDLQRDRSLKKGQCRIWENRNARIGARYYIGVP